MNIKRYLVFALSTVLSLSLFACGGTNDFEIEAVRLRANSYLVVSTDDFSRQVGDLVTSYFPENLEQPPVGSLAKIRLSGEIRESYPPQTDAKSVELIEEKASVVTNPNVAERIAWHLGENAFLIDVRSEGEYTAGHISGAILMPPDEIADRILVEIPEREAVLLLYCRTGNRSAAAAKQVRDLGYAVVIDAGGIVDYEGDLITGSDPGQRP
ncbi:MAG: rhodanese-like domain-containing protein [Eubacteriales bacterium]|nr:rhodanese-like domain-containing protein [Eubacteriales bacterium]MDD4324189.1 rhodanese-like domain-containing protein [Eubacteriales bacterium]MDD4540593.1 rhodanese-like domain-containing protein [Eubacteriales bacterium]